MSDNYVNLVTQEFTSTVQLLLQQTESLVSPAINQGMHVGKAASPVNQVGNVQFQTPSGKFAPLNRQDPEMTRRWVFPTDAEAMVMIDSFDRLKSIADPQSAEAQAVVAAANRYKDDRILNSFFATSYTGPDTGNLSSETFNTTNFRIASTFGASSATGLTVAKIIEARRILRHYHNTLETDMPTMVIGSQQEADLLNQVQVVSTEYNDRPVLVDGRLKQFLGFNIIVSERIPYGSNLRQVPCFVKSGMHLGIWQDVQIDISQRKDLSSQPYQIYAKVSMGATRTEPGKVLQILCADTTGGDITP